MMADKSCPFCGKDGHLLDMYYDDEDGICCNNPLCEIGGQAMPKRLWNTRQPDQELVIQDLAMLIRRLCAGQDIANKAIDYLNRKGLQGNILRDAKEM